MSMDTEALFKISHGLYITGAKDGDNRLIGSCIDSVMVAEQNPVQILISLNKGSYTCETVLKTGQLSLSVLPRETSFETVRIFGFQSSRAIDKWKLVPHHIYAGLPILDGAVSYIIAKAISYIETAGHWIFLCDVTLAERGTMGEVITYADYQSAIMDERKQ